MGELEPTISALLNVLTKRTAFTVNTDKVTVFAMAQTLSVDYLVVGAGAMGMAFVDTMLSDTDVKIAVIDRYARPRRTLDDRISLRTFTSTVRLLWCQFTSSW